MSNMMLRHNFNENPMNELMRTFFGHFPEWNTFYQEENRMGGLQVKVHDNNVCVKLPFPGCTPKDFDIQVVGDYLTVRAQHSAEKNHEEKGNYICRERSMNSYQESVKLPVKVLGEQTKAKYTDGVLMLSIPRDNQTEKKTIKSITVE